MLTQFNILCQESTLYEAWNAVKSKGSAGGGDGMTIAEFNKEKIKQIKQIQEELQSATWKPQPYLQIAIPKTKDPNEKRILGLAVVRDKIVQQAIRKIIEPRFERLFLPNSFAYRPGKGALRTIKYIVKQCGNKDYQFSLRLDVDNYFDEIDHVILQQRLTAIGIENELIRLIMLSVKMGRVKQSGSWTESTKGIPQGAVISPLLANLYLHSFDQFAVSKGLPYARYGDDAVFLCNTQEQAEEIKKKAEEYLSTKLKLSLNTPVCSSISDGFDFLGVTIKGQSVFITDKKREELEKQILGFFFGSEGLLSKERKSSNPMWPNGSNTSLTISDMKRKHFYVVTYDVSDDKRRGKVVKLLEGIGTRMNFSVFECMLTDIQYRNMCSQLSKIVVKREDWVNIYPLCTECYARIAYIPDIKKKEPVKIAVV